MGIKVDSTSHSVDDGFGLLVDFLLHEMVVLSLHDFSELNFEMLNSSDGRETVVSSKSVNVEFWISADALCGITRDVPPSAMWAISSSSR